ncbi:MAG: Ig domain-containing protein, partial [Bacteroidales bacterium]
MATCDFTITQPVSGVTLDKSTLTLTEGDQATLTATVSPEDASNKEISWSTSDASIVSLDQTGNVLTVKATAVKEGSAKVTVTTKDGNKTAECAVTVNKKIIHVTDITLNKTSDTLIVDETLQLAATVKPDDATDKSFTWSSSKPSVASVDANGLVTAVAVGYATITATTTDGSHLASCDLKVKEMGINIPDANFKKYLVRNFDSNGDGEISETEASKVESISCISKDISSLAGIEYFTSLKYLNCSGNHLTGLDASLMADNVTLYCGNQTDADGKETWLSLTLRLAQSKQWQWAKGSGDNVRVSVTYKDAETNVINIPDANFRKYILDKYCGG